MGRVEGKVAFITGAARGQGRSHAVRLAEEGADIIAVDICGPVDTIDLYSPATSDEMAETVALVEKLDRRIVSTVADVRDSAALTDAVERGVAELGRLDIVCANAGIFQPHPSLDLRDDAWQTMIDINLTGVWNTCRAALPHLISAGGGSIVIISSSAGLKGTPNAIHYTAAKHGVVGIMRTIANEFATQFVRCNTVHPAAVNTPMIRNEGTYRLFDPANPSPTSETAAQVFQSTHALPIAWAEPEDIANAVAFLASDEARYITGATLPVDAGYAVK